MPNCHQDIVCTHVKQVAEGFHPRHQQREIVSLQNFTSFVTLSVSIWIYLARPRQALNIQAMQSVAEIFVGDHDFDAFRAQGCTAKSTFRTITRAEILTRRMTRFILRFKGKGFLRHMVRIMTGAIVVAVGLGQTKLHHKFSSIESFGSALLGQTAPPHGLWLVWTSLLDIEDETE